MSTLEDWAKRWGVPPAALLDLAYSTLHIPSAEHERSEEYVQSKIRLEAAQLGIYLFRNNNGAGKMESGNFVRFGLGNDSPQLNKQLKSGDLIGIRKRLIVAKDVGSYIGQFISREVKRTTWKYSGSAEEIAQVKWATLINSQGGDAKIVNSTGSF